MKMKLILFLFILIILNSYLLSAVWQKTGNLPQGVVESIAVNPKTGSVFTGIYGEGLYRSSNGGQDWSKVGTGLGDDLIKSILVLNDGSILVGLNGKGIYISNNDGSTFTESNNGLTNKNILCLFQSSDGKVYAGSWFYGLVHQSLDNGKNWTDYGAKGSDFHSVLVSKSKAVFGGSEYNGLYKNTDDGKTWKTLGFYTYTIYSLVNAPNGDIVAGASNGVSISTDDGTKWTKINNGLSITVARSLIYSQQGTLFTATPAGVFKYSSKNSKWNSFNDGIDSLNQNVFCFALDQNNFLYVGTADGIYKTTNTADSKRLNLDVKPLTLPILEWNDTLTFNITVLDEDSVVVPNTKINVYDSLLNKQLQLLTDANGKIDYQLIVPEQTNNNDYKIGFNAEKSGFYSTSIISKTVTVNHINSVKESIYSENIKIYPVPSFNNLNFEINSLFLTGLNSIKIYDVNGNVVLLIDKQSINGNINLDISLFSPGQYLVIFEYFDISIPKSFIKI